MTTPSSSLQDQINALRDNYVAQLPAKISAIEDAWRALLKNPWNEEDLTRVTRLVHTLIGSGATFGVPDVSNAAREMETALKSLSGSVPNAERRAGIEPLLESLKRAGNAAQSQNQS